VELRNRIQGKRNTKRGQAAEEIAELWLRQHGYACIEKIETPWRIVRRGGKIVGATPKKQVSGDFTAIDPHTGRCLHVEVKSRERNTLRWSDFEAHQIEALDRKAEAGAECLVLWVKGAEVQFFDWPIPGFCKGQSLKWEG
jgi:Holliday junction resolvase-like predicted endonuclease